jgi:flagellar basal-body rod modification protein FlgD
MQVDTIGNILNPANPATAQNNTIDQEDFIKLFLSQLQFQDPLEPVDNREFLAQLAQFSNLEQTRQTSLNTENALVMNSSAQALGLLNRVVNFTDLNGATATGRVIAVRFTQQGPELSIQPSTGAVREQVRLAQITLVSTQ